VYLRRLEVHGFKAFAERQRFEFGNGMSVIVGPNGSGKSNVADAIRWALGEQSSKQIRARKTEDVIFSGSDKRRQMGMAEVTLTLDNSEGWMPIDFAEVSVTRRAHRSGDNEYLINGQQVRLTDVLDLFRRAQVGQNSYAHMSQGLVDQVLALRPGERRELIEEAADLKRHRHQLTLSERRLVETRDNLGHVRMLIREVEPRLRQLERQSRKAERYQTYAAELSDALQVYLEHELRDAKELQTAAQATHDQKSRGFAEAQSKMAQIERRLEGLSTALEERREALETAQQDERRFAEEGLRLEQAVALAEQRMQLIGERSEELTAAVEAAPAEASAPADDEAALAALAASAEQARSELAREREALTAADETTRTILRELGEMEARRARLEAEREDAERRIGEQSRERARREHERAAATERYEALSGELRLYRGRSSERRRATLALGGRQRGARAARDAAEAALEQAQTEQEVAARALHGAEASLHALVQRHELLEQLTESMETAQGGSRAVIEAGGETDPRRTGEPLEGVVDLVSRLIQVPSGLETAIEAALAEHLSAVVVEREEDAIAAIEYLRSEETGATTIYPLDRLEHVYPVNIFNERGVVGVAARLVKTEQKYRPLVDTLLGRVIVVEDLKVAQAMVRRGLGSVVTRDGVLLRPNGSVYGGRGTSGAEQFGLRRELESLPERRDAAMLQVSKSRESAERAERVVVEARAAIVVERDALDSVDIEARTFEQERARERRVHGQVLSDLRSLRSVLDQDERAEEQAQETRTRLDQAEASLTTVAESITRLRDRSTSIGTERDAAAARVDEATRTLASRETEHRSETARRKERADERRVARERLEQQRTQLATLTREQQDLELSLQDYRQRLANNRSARTEAQGAVGPAHAAVAQREEEERELTTSRHDVQRNLLHAEREMLTSESAVREQATRVTGLLEQVEEESMELLEDGRVIPKVVEASVDALEEAVDDEVAASEAAAEPVVEEPVQAELPVSIAGGAEVDIPVLRDRIHELRGSIRSLGPVNLEALEDLSEEAERHEFLTGQIEDLEGAEAELRDAIRELRKLIRERFVETFEVVNVRFGEYFTRFFGGGQAELRLLQNEDEPEAEPGVEIYAQPPGKRVANLNVLSGGERSMTSVALLFSLLAVNPAPMVVLDEVDAALDEANVGRFVETLKELRERTQFVVISHNRTTIEAGDAIYGVSMGEDSTSQVLSLMLEQATETVAS